MVFTKQPSEQAVAPAVIDLVNKQLVVHTQPEKNSYSQIWHRLFQK
ncbi:MAG: hypothetical protein AAFO95_21310 [Cyanobacteria bacterium J06600_6]